MKIETQAKRIAKEILLQYGISEPTLENVIFIIEEHGYELLEYSSNDTTSAIYQVIEKLNLLPYALSGKAFAYRSNDTKVVFVCEEMSASEKLYALAHELGHIVCCHLGNGMADNEVEQEYMANEFAHFLLNPPAILKVAIGVKNHKKATIISAICVLLAIVVTVVGVNIAQSKTYYKEYYITEGGEKYHEKDCIFVKDKTNTRRLTEKDFYSGEYDPCQICLPD